jgi:hypothetical protein
MPSHKNTNYNLQRLWPLIAQHPSKYSLVRLIFNWKKKWKASEILNRGEGAAWGNTENNVRWYFNP